MINNLTLFQHHCSILTHFIVCLFLYVKGLLSVLAILLSLSIIYILIVIAMIYGRFMLLHSSLPSRIFLLTTNILIYTHLVPFKLPLASSGQSLWKIPE